MTNEHNALKTIAQNAILLVTNNTKIPLQFPMSSSKFSYQKLKKLPTITQEEDEEEVVNVEEARGKARVRVVFVRRSWLRLRRRRWARPRVRIARLGRLLRKEARVVRSALRKLVKRLKEGKPYIGDLFAGNYMFMQVSPSPIKFMDKSLNLPRVNIVS